MQNPCITLIFLFPTFLFPSQTSSECWWILVACLERCARLVESLCIWPVENKLSQSGRKRRGRAERLCCCVSERKKHPFTVWLSREGKICRCDSLVLILLSLKITRAFIYKCVPPSVRTTAWLQTLLLSFCIEEQTRNSLKTRAKPPLSLQMGRRNRLIYLKLLKLLDVPGATPPKGWENIRLQSDTTLSLGSDSSRGRLI